jgi:hypothetical protein
MVEFAVLYCYPANPEPSRITKEEGGVDQDDEEDDCTGASG